MNILLTFDKIGYYLKSLINNLRGERRNMFKKKEDQFYLHLANISANLTVSMKYFSDYKLRNTEDLAIFFEKMKD